MLYFSFSWFLAFQLSFKNLLTRSNLVVLTLCMLTNKLHRLEVHLTMN